MFGILDILVLAFEDAWATITSCNPVKGTRLAFANLGSMQMTTANETSGIGHALAWEDSKLSFVGAGLSRDKADRQRSS